jgi:hypothetical protein
MRRHATFETPWGTRVQIQCDCGATFCVPLARQWARCRRCKQKARLHLLEVGDSAVPPPCRDD